MNEYPWNRLKLTNKDHMVKIGSYLDIYFKNKAPDCILYSNDGYEFKIHKEIFSQTNFLRQILASATGKKISDKLKHFPKIDITFLLIIQQDPGRHCILCF